MNINRESWLQTLLLLMLLKIWIKNMKRKKEFRRLRIKLADYNLNRVPFFLRREHSVLLKREQTTYVLYIHMYNTGERRVQRSFTWMPCGNHSIIRWPYVSSIISHQYVILSKSLLYHCYLYFEFITRKMKYSKVKTNLKKVCIKSVALKRAVMVFEQKTKSIN